MSPTFQTSSLCFFTSLFCPTFFSLFYFQYSFPVFIIARWFPSSSPPLPSNSRFSLYLFPLDSREPLSQLCTFCGPSSLFSSKSVHQVVKLQLSSLFVIYVILCPFSFILIHTEKCVKPISFPFVICA